MPDRKKVIKGLEQFKADLKPFCGNRADWERFDAGLAMLKEQEEQIKNRDESLEKAREEIKWLRGMLKEQEALAVREDKVNKCMCGNEINRYWHPEYCGFCGKKLEWY